MPSHLEGETKTSRPSSFMISIDQVEAFLPGRRCIRSAVHRVQRVRLQTIKPQLGHSVEIPMSHVQVKGLVDPRGFGAHVRVADHVRDEVCQRFRSFASCYEAIVYIYMHALCSQRAASVEASSLLRSGSRIAPRPCKLECAPTKVWQTRVVHTLDLRLTLVLTG